MYFVTKTKGNISFQFSPKLNEFFSVVTCIHQMHSHFKMFSF